MICPGTASRDSRRCAWRESLIAAHPTSSPLCRVQHGLTCVVEIVQRVENTGVAAGPFSEKTGRVKTRICSLRACCQAITAKVLDADYPTPETNCWRKRCLRPRKQVSRKAIPIVLEDHGRVLCLRFHDVIEPAICSPSRVLQTRQNAVPQNSVTGLVSRLPPNR